MTMKYEEMLDKAFKEMPKKSLILTRFEIPKFESERSGSKTIIRNFRKVVDSLRRKEEHLAKYIIKECGTSGSISGKELILNGKFSNNDLNRKLEKYVNEFIICEKCKRPDTKLIKENRINFVKCDACGHRKVV